MLTTQPKIIENFVRTGRVKLVFRDVLNHDYRSRHSSEAAACAGRQEKFWHMHRALFDAQYDIWHAFLDDAVLAELRKVAERVDGLDLDVWDACMRDDLTLPGLLAADAEQRGRGIRFQPVFEIVSARGVKRMFGELSLFPMAAAIETAEQP